MNRLSKKKRAEILGMLVEGVSMRATSRLADVNFQTVNNLLVNAGAACRKYHDENVVGIPGRRNIQCDEIWAPIYAKDKAKSYANPIDEAGSAWAFVALDADTKLVTSYHSSMNRDARAATKLMRDLKSRLDRAPRLSADKLEAYKIAVRRVFGGRARLRQSKGDGATSLIERLNLTIRMGNRRFTRKTNAFSKRHDRHIDMLHLLFLHYNFCRIHSTIKVSPSMEAGIDDQLRDLEWIVGLIDANTPPPKKPGPKVGTKCKPRKKKRQ